MSPVPTTLRLFTGARMAEPGVRQREPGALR
jgi:hypothetical protein